MLTNKFSSKFIDLYYDMISKPIAPLRDLTMGRNLESFESTCKDWISANTTHVKGLPSISFVYRLKDADPFLSLSLASVLPIASEIILVDNNSQDRTIDIVSKFIDKFGKSIPIHFYKYEKNIHKQGINYKAMLEADQDGSLAKYYNFCFSKATSDYVFKIDAHKILIPSAYESITAMIRAKHNFIFMRGYDFYGRNISYEPLLYKNQSDFCYMDGTYFEYLNYKDHLRLEDVYRSRIHRHAFVHLKSITYPITLF